VLLPILFNEIGATVENGVRRVVGEIEEEGLVLVPLNEIDRFEIQPVGQIFILAEAIIPVEAVIGRSRLEFRLVMSVTRQMPLADHPGGVAVFLQFLRQGDQIGRQAVGGIRPEVIQNSQSCRMLPGQQRGPIRGTDRRRRVGLRETHALLRHPIEIGCLVECVAIATEFRPAEIIGEHEHDVGFCGRTVQSEQQAAGKNQHCHNLLHVVFVTPVPVQLFQYTLLEISSVFFGPADPLVKYATEACR